MSKRISIDKKCEIINYYKKKPMTINELSFHFGISNPTIIKILNEFKIKRYSKVNLYSPNLIENYFDSIDTEKKAYFLGLIITDGCVYNSKNRQNLISISLQDEDKYLIEDFKKELNTNKTITSDGRGCSELSILSNKLVSGLSKFGVVPNKSLKTIFPTNIDIKLYPHLLRGIFDGDGSISFYDYKSIKRNTHVKAIRLCQGNKKFLEDIVDFLYYNYDIEKVNIFREKENLWSIAYRKIDSMLKLISILYSNSHIEMKRKHELCKLIQNECQ